jgi:hypothetical protein
MAMKNDSAIYDQAQLFKVVFCVISFVKFLFKAFAFARVFVGNSKKDYVLQ